MPGSFHPDRDAIRAMLTGKDEVVGRYIAQKTLKVHGLAREKCPVRTGRLRSSIRWQVESTTAGPVGIVSTDVEYAFYVHEGTRFMRGQPFLLDALKEVAP